MRYMYRDRIERLSSATSNNATTYIVHGRIQKDILCCRLLFCETMRVEFSSYL